MLREALTPFSRRLLLILGVAELAVIALYFISLAAHLSPFWQRLLNLDMELTLTVIFTSVQLLAVGLAAVVIGLFSKSLPAWQRIFWWFLAGVFFFLGVDEYFEVHEAINTYLEINSPFLIHLNPVGETSPWAIVYSIAGLAFVGINLGAYRLGFGEEETGLIVLLLGGLAVMALGGIGIEVLNWHLLCTNLSRLGLCQRSAPLEEFLEMAGGTIVLAAFASHAHTRLGDAGWRLTKLALAGGSALSCVWLVGTVWILPGVEARYLAEPVRAEYFDGALKLVGYRTSHADVVAPGDRMTVKLYWVVDRHFPADYYLSVHVLTHPEITSVAQEDRPLGGWDGWRTITWLPGRVMRDVVHLNLPEDLPPSGDYWLIVRVWLPTEEDSLDWETAERVVVTQTDRELFEPDTLILLSLTAAPGSAAP